MNWLERYTHAVKAHLPRSMKDDLATELLNDLQDDCEHREQTLGRALTEDEVKALLRERGHPMAVAAGFHPRRTLVSESLFPLYQVVLKWLIIGIAIVQSAGFLLSVVNQADPNYVRGGMQLIWSIFNAGLYSFAWVTLVFYLIGESLPWTDIVKNWRPESLPRVTPRGGHISQTGSTIELIVYLFVLTWLNQLVGGNRGDGHLILALSNQWSILLPWINATLVAVMALTLVKLLSPYWTRPKIIAEWLLYIPSITILAIIASWESPIALVIGSEDPKTFVIPDQWIDIGLLGYIVAAAVDVISKVRIISRL